jgi:FixJ family two-component response regulator
MLPTRKSVFVVDDDPSMRMGIKRLLREHGISATLFDSANALLSHGDFGNALCAVLDIDLKGESGIALLRSLADRGVRLPVIYITGNDSDANRTAALESGCIAYLTKPFAAQAFIESIERVRAAVT